MQSPAKAKRDFFLETLRQAQRRITAQRRLICEYLAETDAHPTPYQVYSDLSAAHPEISRATVYNTLNTLQELGAIVEIGFGAGHAHYDTNATPHVNLICLRCHKIIDYAADHEGWGPDEVREGKASDEAPSVQGSGADEVLGEPFSYEVSRRTGFQPVAVRMDVLGFCPDCQARKRAEIRAQWLAQRK